MGNWVRHHIALVALAGVGAAVEVVVYLSRWAGL